MQPVSQVTFTKAKLDEEDGILVYEIEFIKNNLEYEYAIQAADGALLKSDVEQEDEKCDDPTMTGMMTLTTGMTTNEKKEEEAC